MKTIKPMPTLADEKKQCDADLRAIDKDIRTIAEQIAFEKWWRENVGGIKGKSLFAQTYQAFLAGWNHGCDRESEHADTQSGLFALFLSGVAVGAGIAIAASIFIFNP